MTFGDSIKICFSKYADFNGRASRSEFWWFALFGFLVSLVLGFIFPLLSNLFCLGVLLPSLAVGARRLHDIDKSGWLQLVWLIPIIGVILMIYWAVQPGGGPNRYGEPPLLEAVA